ncbi:hypothetical protein [Halosegnis sp.]
MSSHVVFALIALVVVVLILFGVACVHYLGGILSEVDEEDDHGTSH